MVLFSKFGKTVQDLFKTSKYELKRTVSVKNTGGSSECTTEFGFPMSDEGKSDAKVLLKYTHKTLGTCEVDMSKLDANKMDYQLPNLMDGLKVNLVMEDVETAEKGALLNLDLGLNLSLTAEYQKGNLAGKISAKVGEEDRVTAEGAAEYFGVWLGGEAVLSNKGVVSYKAGGHYQLLADTQIDVTLEDLKRFDVKIHNQYSSTGEVAVEYDLNIETLKPVFTLGGKWKLDEKCTTQGFVNSEWKTHLLYKHKLSERVNASLGTSFDIRNLQHDNVDVHYKLEMEV